MLKELIEDHNSLGLVLQPRRGLLYLWFQIIKPRWDYLCIYGLRLLCRCSCIGGATTPGLWLQPVQYHIYICIPSNVDDFETLWKVEGWQRATIARLSNLYGRSYTKPQFDVVMNVYVFGRLWCIVRLQLFFQADADESTSIHLIMSSQQQQPQANGEKVREGRLRWFGHVKRRPQTVSVRRVEAMLVAGSRRRGIPKLRWEDKLKHDMKEFLLSEDITSDRIAWRDRIRISLTIFEANAPSKATFFDNVVKSSKLITVGTKLGDSNVTDSFRRTPRGGAEQQQLDEMVTLINSISLAHMADRMC
nr:polyprotein, putative [Tanacetum cinerariifolium]